MDHEIEDRCIGKAIRQILELQGQPLNNVTRKKWERIHYQAVRETRDLGGDHQLVNKILSQLNMS